MSQTFSLVCHETRQTIWVGQGWRSMTSFYWGQPSVMRRLHRFLEHTRGKPLVLLCDHERDDIADYEEFEDPDPDGDGVEPVETMAASAADVARRVHRELYLQLERWVVKECAARGLTPEQFAEQFEVRTGMPVSVGDGGELRLQLPFELYDRAGNKVHPKVPPGQGV